VVIAGAAAGANATPRKTVLAGAMASVVAVALLPVSVMAINRLVLLSLVVA